MSAAACQAAKLDLPQKKGSWSTDRSNWRLFNDLIDLLAEKSLGFRGGVEKTLGRQFVNTLSNVLFELLVPERMERLANRGIKGPDFFCPLFSSDTKAAYNAREKHRHTLATFSGALIETLATSLREVLVLPFLQGQRWIHAKHATSSLLQGLER